MQPKVEGARLASLRKTGLQALLLVYSSSKFLDRLQGWLLMGSVHR